MNRFDDALLNELHAELAKTARDLEVAGLPVKRCGYYWIFIEPSEGIEQKDILRAEIVANYGGVDLHAMIDFLSGEMLQDFSPKLVCAVLSAKIISAFMEYSAGRDLWTITPDEWGILGYIAQHPGEFVMLERDPTTRFHYRIFGDAIDIIYPRPKLRSLIALADDIRQGRASRGLIQLAHQLNDTEAAALLSDCLELITRDYLKVETIKPGVFSVGLTLKGRAALKLRNKPAT